jgi:hypothetical protein
VEARVDAAPEGGEGARDALLEGAGVVAGDGGGLVVGEVLVVAQDDGVARGGGELGQAAGEDLGQAAAVELAVGLVIVELLAMPKTQARREARPAKLGRSR